MYFCVSETIPITPHLFSVHLSPGFEFGLVGCRQGPKVEVGDVANVGKFALGQRRPNDLEGFTRPLTTRHFGSKAIVVIPPVADHVRRLSLALHTRLDTHPLASIVVCLDLGTGAKEPPQQWVDGSVLGQLQTLLFTCVSAER